jgi:hypothetical protein
MAIVTDVNASGFVTEDEGQGIGSTERDQEGETEVGQIEAGTIVYAD